MNKKTQDTKEELQQNQISEVLAKVEKCEHSFKRVRPNQIECTKCGFGFFDSPDEEFVFIKKK